MFYLLHNQNLYDVSVYDEICTNVFVFFRDSNLYQQKTP